MLSVAALAVLVAACGSLRASGAADEFADEFADRAREVAGHWRSSAERGPWVEGFVPLRNLTLEPGQGRVPRWAGRSLINSAWKLETGLPADAPAPAELRWADGSTLSVPVLPATAAYAGLSRPKSFADEECPPAKGCRPLRVIAVARGEATIPSSRGDVRVPTWDFTVEGVPGPFRRVAVDPAAMGGPPRRLAGGIQEVSTYELRAPAELRLSYLHGTCDTTYGSRVHETPEAVVVDVDVREDDVELCNAMGKTGRIDVTLREPLGRRVVLDSGSGVPLLPESDVRLSEYQNYDPRRS
ncbi:hypothetical protein ACFFV7_45615 [Nonomuraea spiralis]|uniref:Lipoprotein n=1 Tax=Nonomuraea spiralis TaxID=46182 RepID=A0ABV5IVH1_9ACTN|nr:hypothetical protein [Nonomuraea spiralis]GGS83193.1 hypothetical protein GCM10010176_028420 [Nonomuraea spiralis]